MEPAYIIDPCDMMKSKIGAIESPMLLGASRALKISLRNHPAYVDHTRTFETLNSKYNVGLIKNTMSFGLARPVLAVFGSERS